ncbi:MAG: hypothetical protein KAI57_03115 [Candidatus Pacebacteria bacterium]|nr:hypothetical protein [Candidatus Paceibacterota bacterium]
MKKILHLIVISISVLFIGQSSTAFGIGQMTESIVIENARQGESFEEILYIFNTDPVENKFKLSAEGNIEGWVKFYDKANPEIFVEEIIILENSRHDIVAKFEIPNGTPNGQYDGAIGVEIIALDEDVEEKVLTSVGQKIDREVHITVTDDEEINLQTSIIPEKYNLRKDEPLNIRFIYDNQSNIKVNPQIQLKLKKDGKIVHNAIYPYPEELKSVNSFSMKEITPLQIQTTGLKDGKYLAEITIIVNDEIKYDDHFSFTIGGVIVNISNSLGFLGFVSRIGGGNLMLGWMLIGGFFMVLAILISATGKKRLYSIFNFQNKKVL